MHNTTRIPTTVFSASVLDANCGFLIPRSLKKKKMDKKSNQGNKHSNEEQDTSDAGYKVIYFSDYTLSFPGKGKYGKTPYTKV